MMDHFKIVPFTLLIFMAFFTFFTDSRELEQVKRHRRSTISIPAGSTFSITLDVIVPVLPLINQTNTYLWFDFPFSMNMPTASDLQNMYTNFSFLTFTRRRRDLELMEEMKAEQDKRIVYQYMEGLFSSLGLNGPGCLQRAICELAETPLVAGHGLIGKALQLLFSPNHPVGMGVNEEDCDSDLKLNFDMPEEDDYIRAFRKGATKMGTSCSNHFAAQCPLSIFKLLEI